MSTIRFGSVCSGIEAASVAWNPLGWQTAWLAEIEPFPSAVLAHHYPNTPNLGDMTTIARRILMGEVEAPDVFAGGTPCQSFSVAGLRKSLDDARGNLSLKFVELSDAIDHVRTRRGDPGCVVIWENVPGVLSTKDNAFGCFLAGLAGEDEPLVPSGKRWGNAGCVYGPQRAVAWRTLDAQYFGLAQRRRRVFVVASARNGFDPAQVLFEWEGMRRDLAPRRGQAEDAASTLDGGSRERGGYSHADASIAGTLTSHAKGDNAGQESNLIAGTLLANGKAAGSATQQDAENGMLITHSLRGEGFNAGEDGTGRGTPLVPVAFITHAPDVAATMVARSSRGAGQTNSPGHNADEELIVTHSLRGEGFDAGEDGTGRGTPLVPVAFDTYNQSVTGDTTQTLCSRGDTPGGNAHLVPAVFQPLPFDTTQITSAANRSRPKAGDPCHPLAAGAHAPAIAFNANAQADQLPTPDSDTSVNHGLTCSQRAAVAFDNYNMRLTGEKAGAMSGGDAGNRMPKALVGAQVRRLMPEECESLQGFPVGYTRIKWRGRPADECPDGPRYKALGNSWAVPVAHWVGKRIDAQLKRLNNHLN